MRSFVFTNKKFFARVLVVSMQCIKFNQIIQICNLKKKISSGFQGFSHLFTILIYFFFFMLLLCAICCCCSLIILGYDNLGGKPSRCNFKLSFYVYVWSRCNMNYALYFLQPCEKLQIANRNRLIISIQV